MQPTKWNTKTNLNQKVCLIVSCDISTNVLENSPYRIMQRLIQWNIYITNEVLGVTNNFLYPSNSKIYGKVPQYNATS